MNENAELIRRLVKTYDLDLVSPPALDGLMARDRWLGQGKIPAGYYDVAPQVPATDKDVAQVDTLLLTNRCIGSRRARRLPHAAQRRVPGLRARQPAALAEIPGRGAARRRSRGNSSPMASRRCPTAISRGS